MTVDNRYSDEEWNLIELALERTWSGFAQEIVELAKKNLFELTWKGGDEISFKMPADIAAVIRDAAKEGQ